MRRRIRDAALLIVGASIGRQLLVDGARYWVYRRGRKQTTRRRRT